MSPLAPLHNRLSALRQRRRQLRWSLAWSGFAIAMLWALGIVFALDFLFELNPVQRLVLIVLGFAGVVWAVRKFALPWLGIRESETDVALLLERKHGIDTDLVAALQFDRHRSPAWGSLELQTAVISRLANLDRSLDVKRGIDYTPLKLRAKLLGASLILAAIILIAFPRHAAVFFARLFLSQRHYPSRTTIESISLNQTLVWEWNPYSSQPRRVRLAKGRPVKFLIECRDELPEAGIIECRSRSQGTVRKLDVKPLADDSSANRLNRVAEAGPKTIPSGWYVAELPHLVEDFDYILRLGDAFSDPARVEVIEPPVVEMSVDVEPPEYAASTLKPNQSTRHISVLERSRVNMRLRCVNDKRLESATIQIEANGEVSTHSMVLWQEKEWLLPMNTPLANVAREMRYRIQVVDEDGLCLDAPLSGMVQIKTDRPPTVGVSLVHRVVLPDAKPVIEYRLNDDFGVASAVLQIQIERIQADSAATPMSDSLELPVALNPSPLSLRHLPFRGSLPLDLVPWKLAKGDQLKITLVVVDHRGHNVGQSQASDPLMLEISDEAGVLAAITEADERSEKRLSDVIKQQLGVGGTK